MALVGMHSYTYTRSSDISYTPSALLFSGLLNLLSYPANVSSFITHIGVLFVTQGAVPICHDVATWYVKTGTC